MFLQPLPVSQISGGFIEKGQTLGNDLFSLRGEVPYVLIIQTLEEVLQILVGENLTRVNYELEVVLDELETMVELLFGS